ncbi:hypothetical protein PNEG_02353 [Pneumocystis murina B123]|uniref:Transcription factor IIIC putative zinc-finger domain-containing protein n=1 Tax=Pneumocystis murina (strain B123) TaxID=1069680 RepID=M7NL68_PNEMU|nr:hypothetical protein PNEG_02353 [Pneumocystis murina B123]EMR09408.1 hypothetical protein PNEG_02353 [Pneumocystis murina B123]
MIKNVKIGLPFTLNSCKLSKDGIIGIACGTRVQLISWNTSFQSQKKDFQVQDIDLSSYFELQENTYIFHDKKHFYLSESSDTFIKEIDWSPTGVSESKNCVLAILTSKHVVYIFKPYKNPYSNKWVLLHNISKITIKYLFNSSKPNTNITDFLKSRARCILWSPTLYTQEEKWGKCYLGIGNEYGEIELWSITSEEAVLSLKLKVLETWVTKLSFSPWIQENVNTYCSLLSVSGESGPTRIIKLSVSINNENVYLISPSIKKLYVDNNEFETPSNNSLWLLQSTILYLILIHVERISVFQCSVTFDPIFIKYLHTGTFLQASGTSIIYNGIDPIGFLVAYHNGLIQTFTFSKLSNEIEPITNNITSKLKEQLSDYMQTHSFSEFNIRIYGLSSLPPFLYQIFICEIIPSDEIRYITHKQAEAKLVFLESSNISNEKILKVVEQYVISNTHFSTTCMLWDLGLSKFFNTSYREINFLKCFDHLKKFNKEISDEICQTIPDKLFNSKFLNSQRLLNSIINMFKMKKDLETIYHTIISNLRSHLIMTVLSESNYFHQHTSCSLLTSKERKLIMLYCSFIINYFPNDNLLLSLLKIWKQHFLSSELLQIHDWKINTEEYCNVCKSNIPFKNVEFGTCEKKHTWPRCSITLFTLMDTSPKTCQNCSRKRISFSNQDHSFVSKLIDACDICFYCGGRWYSKI